MVWYSFSAGFGEYHSTKKTDSRQATWLMQQPQLKYVGNCNKAFMGVFPAHNPPSSDHFTPDPVGWAPNRHICTKWHCTSGQLTKPGWALFPSHVKMVFSWEIWFEAKKATLVFWEERLSAKNCFRTILPHSVPKEGKRASLLWEKNEADILEEAQLRQESRPCRVLYDWIVSDFRGPTTFLLEFCKTSPHSFLLKLAWVGVCYMQPK